MFNKKGGDPRPPQGNPYMGFGGFGGPGVRETKVVGETSEIKIPRKQFLETWVFSFLILLLGYACLKLIIRDRGDWSLLIGILTFIFVPALYIWFERKIAYKFFPNVYAEFIAMLSRIVHTDDAGRFLLFAFVVSIIVLVSVGFYIYVLVPQLVIILNDEAQFVFVFMAFFSLVFAFIPYYQFNRRQLTDSLRDSDSHYATRALELEAEHEERKHEALMAVLNAPPEVPEEDSPMYSPVRLTVTGARRPSVPTLEAQNRFKVAVLDFLDGIDQGRWDTSERSWRNEMGQRKILTNSKMPLMKLGPDIRDALINGGWGEWNDPDDTRKGWRLLFTTEEIRHGAFRGNEFQRAEDDGSGGSEDILDAS
jgi:hypothetical protein